MLSPTPEEVKAAGTANIPAAVLTASRSPKLWTLRSTGAMKHFKLRHHEYKLAQRIARSVRPQEVADALDSVDAQRLKRRVVHIESKYPLIHRKLVEGTTPVAEVASHYPGLHSPEMTRARAYQIKDLFYEFVAATAGVGHEKTVLREVEQLAATDG